MHIFIIAALFSYSCSLQAAYYNPIYMPFPFSSQYCQYASVPDQYASVPDQYASVPDQYASVPDQYASVPDQYASVPDQYTVRPEQQFELDPTVEPFYPQSCPSPMPLVQTAVTAQPIEIWQQLLKANMLRKAMEAEFLEACYQCDPDQVALYLHQGVNPYTQHDNSYNRHNKMSALHKAIIRRKVNPCDRAEVLTILHRFFPDLDKPLYKGLTPLEKACLEGSISGAQQLIIYGASVTHLTNTLSNPLFYALWSKGSPHAQLTLCQLLLDTAQQQNANIASITNDRQQSPLDIALNNFLGEPDAHIKNPFSHRKYYKENLAIVNLILDHTHNLYILRKALISIDEGKQKQQIYPINADDLKLKINIKLADLHVRVILPNAP